VDYWLKRGAGIAQFVQQDGLGSISGRDKRLFSTPQREDRLWGLSNGYRWLFPRRQSGWGVKLTTHLHLESKSRIMWLYLDSPTRLHDVVLNKHKDHLLFPFIEQEDEGK
jgi:hypothetical protein